MVKRAKWAMAKTSKNQQTIRHTNLKKVEIIEFEINIQWGSKKVGKIQ